MSTQKKERGSLSSIRWGMQWVFVFVTMLLGLRHIMPGRESKGGDFDVFCPFGGIETLWPYITTGHTLKTTNLLNFAVLIGVLGLSLVAGRAFCGWMCPLGTVQDLFARWSRRWSGGGKRHIRGKRSKARFPTKLPPKWDKWLRYLKYLILAVILVASTTSIYPPLREICPARAVFSFQLTTPLLWSVLITFVITSLLNKRLWCKYLCPLGAVLAVFNKTAPLRVTIKHERCNHCGRCDVECPMDIAPIPGNMRSAECVQCLECLETCSVPETLELKLG